jgi:hypothetical protein
MPRSVGDAPARAVEGGVFPLEPMAELSAAGDAAVPQGFWERATVGILGPSSDLALKVQARNGSSFGHCLPNRLWGLF